MSLKTLLLPICLALPALINVASSSGSYYQGYQQMLQLVNQARAQAGVPQLCDCDKLMASALAHSQYQASINTLTHNDPVPLMQRFTNQGFQPLAVAENVAQTPSLDVTTAFNLFMSDAEHKGNVLGASYTHFGSAVVQGSNGQYYWTQHFAQAASPNEPCMSATSSSQSQQPTQQTSPSSSSSSMPQQASPLPGGMNGPTPGLGGAPSTQQPSQMPSASMGQQNLNSQSLPSPGSSLNVEMRAPTDGPQLICMQGKCYQIVKTRYGDGFLPTPYRPPNQNIQGGPLFV